MATVVGAGFVAGRFLMASGARNGTAPPSTAGYAAGSSGGMSTGGVGTGGTSTGVHTTGGPTAIPRQSGAIGGSLSGGPIRPGGASGTGRETH